MECTNALLLPKIRVNNPLKPGFSKQKGINEEQPTFSAENGHILPWGRIAAKIKNTTVLVKTGEVITITMTDPIMKTESWKDEGGTCQNQQRSSQQSWNIWHCAKRVIIVFSWAKPSKNPQCNPYIYLSPTVVIGKELTFVMAPNTKTSLPKPVFQNQSSKTSV